MGAHHVYLLALVFKPMREGAQGGAPSDIQVAPVAQQIGGTNSLSWKFIGIPRKPSYSASFFPPTIFWPNSHLVHGYPPSLLILPGLLRSDQGGPQCLLSFGRTGRCLWPM